MILKYLKLTNVRSYTSEKIEFPEGSVLLSGDIGSGKSTILLAIEFALFGTRKKHLTGSTLLRHGQAKANIELCFTIKDKEIIISRSLKRTSRDIKQESGFIVINNVKKELMPTELNAKIIELLGYPKILANKSSSMLYRYTVYTPQEDMKQILYEDKDIRLDTLRKVFNIDKYKNIRENALIIIKSIRGKIREMEGMIFDLDDKKSIKKKKEDEKSTILKDIEKLKQELGRIKKETAEKKAEIEKLHDLEKYISSKKQEYAKLNAELEALKDQETEKEEFIKKLAESIKEEEIGKGKITKEIINDSKKRLDEKEDTIRKKIADLNGGLAKRKGQLREAEAKINENRTMREMSLKTISKISSLNVCPTCHQEVNDDHKKKISDKENEKIALYSKKITEYNKLKEEIEAKIKDIEKGISEQNEKISKLQLIREKLSQIEEKAGMIEKAEDDIKKIKEKTAALIKKISEIRQIIDKNNIDEKEFAKKKKEYEEIADIERQKELEYERQSATLSSLKKEIDEISSEIRKKEGIKEKIKGLEKHRHWLQEFFIRLMAIIEKQVMLKLHNEFNEFFVEWFNIIINNELINARLDDTFSVIVEQNGYDTEIENLSGGEKTAVALAYRLALNKVINNLVTNIKTKDLLILDEPTDGFSSEQLDNVRDVFYQLDIRQIIIVSHEQKVESFVDNIIRIRKQEHESSVGQ